MLLYIIKPLFAKGLQISAFVFYYTIIFSPIYYSFNVDEAIRFISFCDGINHDDFESIRAVPINRLPPVSLLR